MPLPPPPATGMGMCARISTRVLALFLSYTLNLYLFPQSLPGCCKELRGGQGNRFLLLYASPSLHFWVFPGRTLVLVSAASLNQQHEKTNMILQFSWCLQSSENHQWNWFPVLSVSLCCCLTRLLAAGGPMPSFYRLRTMTLLQFIVCANLENFLCTHKS